MAWAAVPAVEMEGGRGQTHVLSPGPGLHKGHSTQSWGPAKKWVLGARCVARVRRLGDSDRGLGSHLSGAECQSRPVALPGVRASRGQLWGTPYPSFSFLM